MIDLDAFGASLRDLRPQSQEQYLRAVQRCAASRRATWGDRFALRRYLQHAPGSRWARELLAGLQPPKRRRAERAPRVSFSEADWAQLRKALARARDPAAWVLRVQYATGVRVGDALGLDREALADALACGTDVALEQKGGRVRYLPTAGAPKLWQALLAAWPEEHPTLAAWVSPTSELGASSRGGAYAAVRARLVALGTELGLPGRLHLHRLRRTYATRALAHTGDVHLVAQLLGHARISATERYLQERRQGDIARLQRELLHSDNADDDP